MTCPASSSSHQNVTSSHHDIAEKLIIWHKAITHLLAHKLEEGYTLYILPWLRNHGTEQGRQGGSCLKYLRKHYYGILACPVGD